MKFFVCLMLSIFFHTAVAIQYTDNMMAKSQPPAGLVPSKVPQFIAIGFDDNGSSGIKESVGRGGVTWANKFFSSLRNPAGSGNKKVFDGFPVGITYFFTTLYIAKTVYEPAAFVKHSWRQSLEQGFEIANHTHSHGRGSQYVLNQWVSDIDAANRWLVKPFYTGDNSLGASGPLSEDNASWGIGANFDNIYGFRAPYLSVNDNAMKALKHLNLLYDSSIEEGWQSSQNGANNYWPYTLDQGSPSNPSIGSHPGLWELPVYVLIVPADDEVSAYGFTYSLRKKIKSQIAWFDLKNGKITGFDYNLFVQAKLNKAEVLAILKYNLDLRIKGNRAPLIFGAHTDIFSTNYENLKNSTMQDRQETIEEFIKYALSKTVVRIVRYKDIIDWMRDPAEI